MPAAATSDLEQLEGDGPTFADIDADDVADWIDTEIEAGLAAKTIRNRHGLLSSIMKHGVLRLKLRPEKSVPGQRAAGRKDRDQSGAAVAVLPA